MNSLNPTIPPPPRWPERADAVVLAPGAFLKLQFFLHAGETEVGGFGLSSQANLLYVNDFVAVRQTASAVSVDLDSRAVADHLDAMHGRDRTADECARIWIHTHPGTSASPSRSDERSFEEACGQCDWAMLLILARSGRTYARLQFRAGPRTRTILPVKVDWSAWPQTFVNARASHTDPRQSWMEEYRQNIRLENATTMGEMKSAVTPAMTEDGVMKIRATRLLPALVPVNPIPVD